MEIPHIHGMRITQSVPQKENVVYADRRKLKQLNQFLILNSRNLVHYRKSQLTQLHLLIKHLHLRLKI